MSFTLIEAGETQCRAGLSERVGGAAGGGKWREAARREWEAGTVTDVVGRTR